MYECQIVEIEDMNLDHYINHFDEFEKDTFLGDDKIEFDELVIDFKECEEFKELYI